MQEEPILDSTMTPQEALAQNPQNPAPPEVLQKLTVLSVGYWGFDDREHIGHIVMHQDLAEDVQTFFALAHRIRFPIEKVIPISSPRYQWGDETSCSDNNTSGYNYRLIAGTNRMSKHAQGCAFDLNPRQNVFVKYDDQMQETFRFPPNACYDPSAPGTLTAQHELVQFMKHRGWTWGGDWKPEEGRVDWQHFEKHID